MCPRPDFAFRAVRRGVVARRRETEFEQMLGEARLLVGGVTFRGEPPLVDAGG